MKTLKRNYSIAALAAAIILVPAAGWATRIFADQITGTITATPVSETIEVDHHVFHVKAGSLAAQGLHALSEGQKVDLILDGPPGSKASAVLKIVPHESE